ncbi:MAG: RNA polymerase factor sigma-32 [Proteobacteria bacterium]|jgi:RNA polymerase sigma-32 factor|nr:RNA polymerase factor sigma-32 [Pseudomonadota bacterium]NLN63435.1 RNA polymerase factor sigma-32 [Myxococcales bacterium]
MTYTRTLSVTTDLDRYLAQIRQYPLLTQEEELRLARKWRDEGDVNAAHTLVTSNLRFVVKVASEYGGYGARILDLIQEGSIGLMQAVKRFDPDKGYRLISYSVFWIRSYIHNFLMSTTRMIRVGTSRAHRKLFFKLRQYTSRLIASTGISADEALDAAAEEFGVTRNEAQEMSAHLGIPDASLDAPAGATGLSLAEVMPSPEKNQEDLLADMEAEAELSARLHEALTHLDPREQSIIAQRYLSESPKQLKEIGDQMGVSKQRVAQLEKRAMAKLQQQLSDLAA